MGGDDVTKRKKGSRYTPKLRRCFICLDEMDQPEAPPPGVEVSGMAHRSCVEDMVLEITDDCDICQADDDSHEHESLFWAD
jgi:hypothetical protein